MYACVWNALSNHITGIVVGEEVRFDCLRGNKMLEETSFTYRTVVQVWKSSLWLFSSLGIRPVYLLCPSVLPICLVVKSLKQLSVFSKLFLSFKLTERWYLGNLILILLIIFVADIFYHVSKSSILELDISQHCRNLYFVNHF